MFYVARRRKEGKKKKKTYLRKTGWNVLLFLVRAASRGWLPWKRTRIDPIAGEERDVEETLPQIRHDLARRIGLCCVLD